MKIELRVSLDKIKKGDIIMKYSIMRDLVDNTYWIVDRITEWADEIKVYESDSLHACFIWFIERCIQK